ncbi:hypothetical protein P7C73_g5274, partial [Tremellales sp. Uapishka_1]
MPSTPRKPSSASTRGRAPISLRVPSSASRQPIPHVSLVFAQGDSSKPQRPAPSTSLSEEALTRQLDKDSGGDKMGLRSRRSSNATVRTMRTVSGMREQSPAPSVREEEEPVDTQHLESVAGPSNPSPPLAYPLVIHPSQPLESTKRSPRGSSSPPSRALNSKNSSSWLRWSSPTPSFPKTGEKGKGREREVATAPSSTIPTTPAEQTAPPLPPPTPPVETTSPPVETATVPPEAPSEDEKPTAIPLPVPGKSSKWWRTRSPANTVRGGLTDPAAKTKEDTVVPEVTTSKPESIASGPSGPPEVISLPPPQPPTAATPPAPPEAASSSTYTTPRTSLDAPRPGEARSWKGYLGWGREGKPSVDSGAAKVTEPEPALQVDGGLGARTNGGTGESERANGIVTHAVEAVEPVEANEAHSPDPVPTENRPSGPEATKSGWSSYLYSIVIPQTNPVIPPIELPSDADAVIPEATPNQISIPSDPAPTVPDTAVASQVLPSTSRSASPSSASPGRKAQNANSSGWLSYLALGTGQKKVLAPSVKTEGTGEEIMDLENDPDFPSGPPPPEEKDTKFQIASSKGTITPKPSQNLGISKKRLSNASVLSAGSSPQLPSSPISSSSLPPPPQAPAVQPNLVIPSFATTFDRPPRSFPPLSEAEPAGGLTAATTGLAWKALGAVGSYYYGAGGDAAEKAGETETRGRKEGRGVGAELPRRLAGDEGWRTVKRVVVVGVHGWFPAKMLNSVIGEPTGTSSKFTSMMGQAVRNFFEEKGIAESDIRLTLIPLEGEGTIEHRVDKLYKAYLSNPAWINDLRRSDVIFFAAHSQGCIVTTHLISRLIAQGHIRTLHNREAVSRCEWAFGPVGLLPPERPRRGKRDESAEREEGGRQKVAMLAMCGVHLGPLYSISTSTVIQPYLQWFENAAARELFEFQDTASAVSRAYQSALAMILDNEVKVLLLSSLNDQVVPIYGSSFSAATHPLLLRALFVDGASYTASDFMTNLLCFAFMLRNAGIDDQGLVGHLSEATAGSLTVDQGLARAVTTQVTGPPHTLDTMDLALEGDAFLYLGALQSVLKIAEGECIERRVIASLRSELLTNNTLAYLCLSYRIHHHVARTSMKQKRFGDLFEAYIGALYRDYKARDAQGDLELWLQTLFSTAVWPDLEMVSRGEIPPWLNRSHEMTTSAWLTMDQTFAADKSKLAGSEDTVEPIDPCASSSGLTNRSSMEKEQKSKTTRPKKGKKANGKQKQQGAKTAGATKMQAGLSSRARRHKRNKQNRRMRKAMAKKAMAEEKPSQPCAGKKKKGGTR